MRLGIAHHLGWAVAITAAPNHAVVDRRRIELIEAGMPTAPMEHDAKALSDEQAEALFARVRASSVRATAQSLDELVTTVAAPITSISLRAWPPDFPEDVRARRHPPFDTRADSVMYCEVLAEAATARGWPVHLYDLKAVESQAAVILGHRADQVLHGPRATWGPPWTKEHRAALAATIVAG